MAVLLGYLNQLDLYDRRVSTVGIDVVTRSIDESVAEHNRQLDALMALFTTRRTVPQTRYLAAAATRLQPLDENGRARPVKPSGYYTVGFPLQTAGSAWGHTYITGQKLTVREVANLTAAMLDADSRWMRDHLLAALFFEDTTNPWTWADPEFGNISVYGLANGDTTTYQILSGADSAATDDHVKGTTAVTEAVIQDMHDELVEHPENGEQVIVFAPTASVATIQALTNFYPVTDMNLNNGVAVTTLAATPGVAAPGRLIGYVGQSFIHEWPGMPADYLLGVTVGGEAPIAMREDEEASLRGFRQVAERNDHPWYERQYMRRAGFGAWNRVGGIVYKTNNATYAEPTGYTSPMP